MGGRVIAEGQVISFWSDENVLKLNGSNEWTVL